MQDVGPIGATGLFGLAPLHQPPQRRPAVPAQDASDNNGFADTMIVDDDGQAPRLGATQYGALR